MGPKQSKEEQERCRQHMRKRVEQSRRNKRLQKDLAGSNYDVLQMDKIGSIEYNPHELDSVTKELETFEEKGKSGREGEASLSPDSAIILVSQTTIVDQEQPARQGSGENAVYQVVDVQQKKSARRDSRTATEGGILREEYNSGEEGSEQGDGDSSGESGSDEQESAMQTLQMSHDDTSSFFNRTSHRADSTQTITSSMILPRFGTNTAELNDQQRLSQAKKKRRDKRRQEFKHDQGACNTSCAIFGARSAGPKLKENQPARAVKKAKTIGANRTTKDVLTAKLDKFQKLVKEDQKRRQDDFETKRQQKMTEKKLAKVNKMCRNEEEKKALLANTETCCGQCNLPYPLLCWRYKVRFNIQKNCLDQPGLQLKPDLKRLEQFSVVDTWRQSLIDFIEQESGNYAGTDKQWLSSFYDYEAYLQSRPEQSGSSSSDSNVDVKQSLNDFKLKQNQEIERVISKEKKQLSVQTGQSVLMCNEKIHDLVLYISKQLENQTHPLRATVDYFKEKFVAENMVLLCKQADEDIIDEPLISVPIEDKMDYAETTILGVIKLLTEAILIFYELDDQIRPYDRTRDLFENLVTNYILEGQLYFLIFNLCSSTLEMQQRSLRKMMFSQETLENKLPIDSLTGLPQFQFDVNFRNNYEKEESSALDIKASLLSTDPYYSGTMIEKSTQQTTFLNSSGTYQSTIKIVGGGESQPTSKSDDKRTQRRKGSDVPYVYSGQPYSLAISDLQKLACLESPMSKLEWIYNCCTRQVSKEIDLFWRGYDIPTKKLFVDPDNLQGIIIYIVSRLRNPQIITQVHFIKKFVPEGVKRLSRFYHCVMVGAACSYLLEVDQKMQAEEKKKPKTKKPIRRSCYDAKSPSQGKLYDGQLRFGQASFTQNHAAVDSSDEEKPSSADSDEQGVNHHDETIKDVVSWVDFAFGQSMRSYQSFAQCQPGASQSVYQNQRRNDSKPQSRQASPSLASGVEKSRGASPQRFQKISVAQFGKASPTFSRSTASKFENSKQEESKAEEKIVDVWVEGTETDLCELAERPEQKYSFMQLEDRENKELREEENLEDDEQPQVELLRSTLLAPSEGMRDTEKMSHHMAFGSARENNLLLNKINRLRQINCRQIEEQQSFVFAEKANQSVMIPVSQVNQPDPYAPDPDATRGGRKSAAIQKRENYSASRQMRSQSMIATEDSFFFQNNKLLEQDLRSRLGEKTAQQIARAKNKGYDQARCISEF